MDQLAADSGYSGVNLLDNGSLKVQFNESNTASITISGVKFNARVGVAASTNNWQSDKDINDALNNLTTGMTRLRNQASTFGSNLSVVQTRQDFTNNMIDTLETGSDLLVLADQNEEAAKLVTLNTRQQLASALSLARRRPNRACSACSDISAKSPQNGGRRSRVALLFCVCDAVDRCVLPFSCDLRSNQGFTSLQIVHM